MAHQNLTYPALTLAALATAAAADLPCPEGALHEDADVCVPQDTNGDFYNGGLNVDPPAFVDVPINTGICGSAGYNAANDFRDTDWYRFTLAAATTVTVEFTAEDEFSFVVLDAATLDAPLFGFPVPYETITVSGELPAGEYYLAVTPDFYFSGVCFAWTATLSGAMCRPDVTTTNTNPGDPGYGAPDGAVDGADLSFYVEQWLTQDAAVADVTTTNTNPGDAGHGAPDGAVDGADLSYYVEAWLAGCA